MAESPEPPFTVSCTAGFREDGVWVIHLTLRYRDGMPPAGDERLGEGRLAILEALVREGLRGRSEGATFVRVFLDEGTGEVVDLDPDGVVARFSRQ